MSHPNSVSIRPCRPANSGARPAFTLVELLVVIGIIALLISILLPSLSTAREAARRTQCLSNVRQLSVALFSYTNDNKGLFPGVLEGRPQEWVQWIMRNPTTGAYRVSESNGGVYTKEIETQGIGRYLGLSRTNAKVLRCPSDPNAVTRPYSLSYVMNYYFSSDGTEFARGSTYPVLEPELSIISGKRITSIQNTSQKVLVYEEDFRRIDDSFGRMWDLPNFGTYVYDIDTLSIVHDTKYKKKEDPQGVRYIPNSAGKGVAAFVDGHAEFTTRRIVHSPQSACARDELYPRTAPAFDYR